FQNYALYPHMTVYKNMAFALKLRGVPKDEIKRRVTSTAETLGIEKLLDRRPKQLSGGQRQRVAVGRAIVREPKAFLFDEPLSNLDAKLRVVTRGELKALHMRLRTTTIYVTHDQEEAMTLGDRVCVMEDGIIQQAASPFEVYQAPANRFVAAFIGTPPMNFFEGDITQADSELWFSDGSTGPDGKAQRIRILPERRDALSDYIGKQVVMGIRPQGFVEARFGDSHESAKDEGRLFHAKVNVVEPLGSEMDVHCSTDTTPRLTARVGAHQHMPVGEWATFGLDPRHVHYFEPGEFGINILASAGIDTLTPKAATT
ncbi:MAG: ATP-binding cassette domain-containing protein, partial [Planctomycetota bacterium]